MPVKRFWLLAALAVLAALMLTGCGARAGAGETAAAATDAALAVDLPALTIDFDSEGVASLGGAPLSSFGALLPAGLADLKLDKATIAQLTAANIQHIQVTTVPSGLLIMVNGEPIPSMRWNDEQLANLGDVVELLGPAAPAALKAVLPIITDVGVGVALRFPVGQGAEMIPMQVAGDASAAATARAAQEAFMTKVGAAPVIRIPVVYDIEGNYTVQGITDAEWQALTGAPFGQLKLNAQLVKDAVAAGITNATVRTDAAGIHIALNGKELPVLGWADGELNHLIKLAAGAGLLDSTGMDGAAISSLVSALLPAIQSSNVEINVSFPAQ
ncbi:MAG TPA: MoaD/ThiS family protein [Chloroflexi bacterium]|nr:MoaD/ThiS family protein [Chloroflexota bacterium]